jgi:hypothetical protein
VSPEGARRLVKRAVDTVRQAAVDIDTKGDTLP